jgi:cytochrome c2
MRLLTVVFATVIFTCGHSMAGEIHDAARAGDVARIDQILSSGVDVNEASSFGTALHFAVLSDQVEAGRLLVEHGADVNAASKALGTPLHVAAREGHVEFAEILIEAGAVIDVRDNYEMTPLHFAALKGSAQITRALLDAGADAKARAFSPGRGHLERGLFEPLQLSEKHGHAEVSALLLAAGGGPKPVEPVGDLIAAGDPESGRELAYKKCNKCHVMEEGDPANANDFGGPPIIGIYGQAVAAADEFDYSPTLTDFGGEWTGDRLHALILHPMLTVPGVRMPEVRDLSPNDAADIVAYLKATAGN